VAISAHDQEIALIIGHTSEQFLTHPAAVRLANFSADLRNVSSKLPQRCARSHLDCG
jgi:hypothetical protein